MQRYVPAIFSMLIGLFYTFNAWKDNQNRHWIFKGRFSIIFLKKVFVLT